MGRHIYQSGLTLFFVEAFEKGLIHLSRAEQTQLASSRYVAIEHLLLCVIFFSQNEDRLYIEF